MNCQEAKQHWHDLCDGTLSSHDQASLAEHLQACDACRRHHAQMDEMNHALDVLRADTEAIETSDGLRKGRGSERSPSGPLRFVLGAPGLTVLNQELGLAERTQEIATTVAKRRCPACGGVHGR